MKKTKQVFRSRISVLIIGIVLAPIMLLIPMIYRSIPSLFLIGGSLAFIVITSAGVRYIIAGDKLHLKLWMIHMGSASITDIISVERTYNPLSPSPAASLKRLCIRFRKGVIYPIWWLTWQSVPNWLLSPVREQEFVETLKTINSAIDVKIVDKKGMWRFWDWDI